MKSISSKAIVDMTSGNRDFICFNEEAITVWSYLEVQNAVLNPALSYKCSY